MTQLISIDNADPTIADATDVALLGFKMAVNEGLTVYNLVDGVVDEFHDETGNDESESSNDTYCASNDNYINFTSTPYSAGFGHNSRTEPDTSNPGTNTYATGSWTVPTGVTSITAQLWGAGGASVPSTGGPGPTGLPGGGGGYCTGTVAVTSEQIINVRIGNRGASIHGQNAQNAGKGSTNEDSFKGAGDSITQCGSICAQGGGGGGASGLATAGPLSSPGPEPAGNITAPEVILIAGGGGGGGYSQAMPNPAPAAGAGGGLVGQQASSGEGSYVTTAEGAGGGGGDQEQGGAAGASVNPPPDGVAGALLEGGDSNTTAPDPGPLAPQQGRGGGGGEGYYGGGGAGARSPAGPSDHRGGGGGSSYYGHPQVTSGATQAGDQVEAGGTGASGYVAPGAGDAPGSEGGLNTDPAESGNVEHGYVLLTGCGAVTATTNIISNAFTASSAPSSARIVVFQETVSSYTLNTDLIASISRDGGTTFTTATLADTGYVTGTSGQRILTGTATVSGQPSGTAMRWKLALANNQSKIHGVSLQWK